MAYFGLVHGSGARETALRRCATTLVRDSSLQSIEMVNDASRCLLMASGTRYDMNVLSESLGMNEMAQDSTGTNSSWLRISHWQASRIPPSVTVTCRSNLRFLL